MVQQATDSKFSQYGLATETGLSNHDKQLPVPLAPKKTALRDLQNDNTTVVPKSVGNPLFFKERGPTSEAVKTSGIKRPTPDCLVSPLHHQSPTGDAGNGHLVYVRRKPEAELGKSSSSDNTGSNTDCSQLRKLGDQDKTSQQKSQMKDSKICIPEVAHIPRASPVSFSSGKLLVGNPNYVLPQAESNHHHVTLANSSLDYPKKMDIQHWEDRYSRLQNLLKKLDQSNQDDYIQMLRSLSSVELSRHAVELEKRSIQLSLEEAKELQRVRLLDVMGKYPKNSVSHSPQQDQSEK